MILESKFYDTLLKFGFNFRTILFEEGNDRKHVVKATKEWLLKQPFSIMKWLLQSPDFNSMENL